MLGQGGSGHGKVYEISRSDNDGEIHAALRQISIPDGIGEFNSLKNEGYSIDEIDQIFRSRAEKVWFTVGRAGIIQEHNNIAAIYDFELEDHPETYGFDVLVITELLTPLGESLRGGVMNGKSVIQLGIEMCSALETVHQSGLVHGNIKPDEIFVSEDGVYKLGGIENSRSDGEKGESPEMMGVRFYAAPEIIKGGRYSVRADIYSLGIIMYQLLNENRLPFISDSSGSTGYTDSIEAYGKRLRGESLPVLGQVPDKLGMLY